MNYKMVTVIILVIICHQSNYNIIDHISMLHPHYLFITSLSLPLALMCVLK